MSLLKAQIRVAITNEIGADLEDQLEQIRKEVHQHEGATEAFAVAGKGIESLLALLKEEIASGKYGLEQGAEVSRWIQRAAGICESLRVKSIQTVVSKSGALAQNERLMEVVKKRHEREKLVLEAMTVQQVRAQDGSGPEPDLRSAPRSIKELRQAEAAAEQPAEATVVAPEVPPAAEKQNGKHKARGRPRSAADA